jgi:hypothetical protein
MYVFISFVFFPVLSLVFNYQENRREKEAHNSLPKFITIDSLYNAKNPAGSTFDRLMTHQMARLLNGELKDTFI